jgi:eukaryotic-like serine/threonine-protein kinase
MALSPEWRLGEAWLHSLHYTVRPSARIGQGGFGQVFIGERNPTGLIVAVKFGRVLDNKAAEQEVATLTTLQHKPHPNIMQLLHLWHKGQQLVTISDYAADDLYKMLRRRAVSSQLAWLFSKDCAEGLAHLHNTGVVRRDLKPSNLLIHLTPNPTLKISDFGAAFIQEASPTSKPAKSAKLTPAVVAPLVSLINHSCQGMFACLRAPLHIAMFHPISNV